MSDVALILGGVIFRDFEVPEQIVFGGGQTLAVHQTIGGGRIVEVLGAVDGEIALAGIFSGPDAISRAQALDVARRSGEALSLIWRGFSYSVLIADFTAAYTKSWWIPFRLRLVVIYNLIKTVSSFREQALLDISLAQNYFAGAGISTASLTVANLSGIESDLLSTNLLLTSTGLNFAQSAESLNLTPDIPAGVETLSNLTKSSSLLANLANAHAYLGRAAIRLIGALA